MRDQYIPMLFRPDHYTDTIIQPRPKPAPATPGFRLRKVQCECANPPEHWLEGHFRCPWCGRVHGAKNSSDQTRNRA